jgi:hypothetical protein
MFITELTNTSRNATGKQTNFIFRLSPELLPDITDLVFESKYGEEYFFLLQLHLNMLGGPSIL